MPLLLLPAIQNIIIITDIINLVVILILSGIIVKGRRWSSFIYKLK
jgi:hypothetical protein